MKITRLILTIFLPITLLCAVTGCGRKEDVAEVEIIRPVKAIRVEAGREGLKRSFSGTVHAGQEASLTFRVGGKVEKILVEVGDKVDKDQVLASLDPHDYELEVKNIESSLAGARAASKNADSSYQRAKGLYENNTISKDEFDDAETQRNQARHEVKALEARMEQAKNQLAYTRLQAPFSGYISAKQVEEFENVATGQPVFTLVDPRSLKVRLGIPESLIRRVKEGQEVGITLESLPAKTFTGRVSEVGVALDTSTGTYPVTVVISKPGREILPGMAGEVTFTFGFKTGQGFIVPTSAILENIQTGERYVWVFSEGKVRKRKVETGALVTNGVEIVSGLKGGEVVVTAGVHQIEEGEKVRLLEE